MTKRTICSVLAAALFCGAAPAQAATLSGTITDESPAPIQNIDVRLWGYNTTVKGYTVIQTVKTNVKGEYILTKIKAGKYKLDARMGAGMSGWYGDRWYDLAQPTGNGYIPEHADEITIKDNDVLVGYNITLQQVGGLDTSVKYGSTMLSGIQIRAEQIKEYRIHHNYFSQASPHLGYSYFRGLPPTTYRLLFHGPDAKYETYIADGPYTVTSKKTTTTSTIALKAMVTDPYEPNNTPTDKGASINSNIFHQSNPVAYVTSGALIGPRNTGDVDWTCFDTIVGDRFKIIADMPLIVGGKTREDPWVDPIMGFYSYSSATQLVTKIKDDDDSGLGNRDAAIDSGVLTAKGRHCVVVSTFGDSTYAGKNQNSAGRYRLTISMGNREPALTMTHKTTTYQGANLPVVPVSLSINEGEKIQFDLSFSDIDFDTLTASMTHIDSLKAPVNNGLFKSGTGVTIPSTGATFKNGKGTAVYTWEASQQAAKTSPYTITFDVKDSEFLKRVQVSLAVIAQNHPPLTPTLNAPQDKSTVNSATPNLVINNSFDVDGDKLTYDFEVYHGSPTGTPTESKKNVPGGTGTTTTFGILTAAKENSWVYWRARANDGHTTSNYSPWTKYFAFFVNSSNDPPTAPVLIKPVNNSTVLDLQPALSVTNPADPEKDTMTILFQVALDSTFTSGLTSSPNVAVNTTGITTSWTMATPLSWDTWYYARAYAKDDKGATSPASNINKFKTRKSTLTPDAGDGGSPDGGPPTDLSKTEGGSGKQDIGTTLPPIEESCSMGGGFHASNGALWLLVLFVLAIRRRRQ